MYDNYGQRQKSRPNPYDARHPVNLHRGDRKAMQERYHRAAAKAVAEGNDGIATITPNLLKWISDPRTLRIAYDNLRQDGGQAPGPDGLTYNDLTDSEAWELLRALRDAIRRGTYQPGPDRKLKIPKTSGSGYRMLRLQNIADRVVARAILQMLQPLIDPGFSCNSFGFRPGIGRQHALHAALQQATDGRTWWAVADIKDAFDHVPVNRLMDIVHKSLPGATDELIALIQQVASIPGRKQGIRQGNPLSPFLLNIYLNHLLDGVWLRKAPDDPLLRTADDLLVLCRTEGRAREVLDLLTEILKPTGLNLNSRKSAARNLTTNTYGKGAGADWLGYHVTWGEQGPSVRIAESSWTSLARKLEEAHGKPASPLRAVQTLYGWTDQLGPCYEYEDLDEVYDRLVRTAEELAFDEVLDADEFRVRWSAAYARWRILCGRTASCSCGSSDNCSACCLSFFSATDENRRSDGAPSGAPSLFFPAGTKVTIHTDGSCDRQTRCGGWAAILDANQLRLLLKGHGMLQRTTNNRAELTAVIRVLQQLSQPCTVRLVSDSQYVVDGITLHLEKWKRQRWRAGGRRHKRDLQNADLWQQVDQLLQPHQVTCEWVRGHAGDAVNEECDRMANAAMQRAIHHIWS